MANKINEVHLIETHNKKGVMICLKNKCLYI